jgi:hypothetical protein
MGVLSQGVRYGLRRVTEKTPKTHKKKNLVLGEFLHSFKKKNL